MIPIEPVQGTPAFRMPTLTPLDGWQAFTSTGPGGGCGLSNGLARSLKMTKTQYSHLHKVSQFYCKGTMII